MLRVIKSVCLNLGSSARPHCVFRAIVCLVTLHNNTKIIMALYHYMECLISINHKGSFCVSNASIEIPL